MTSHQTTSPAVELNPVGLSQFERAHTPNDEYPDQKFGDFAQDYDAELSEYPWATASTCAVCGRIAQRMTDRHAQEVTRRDAARHITQWDVVCSTFCALRYHHRK